MSKYIKLEGLKWHSPDESLVKPLIEFYVTESDIADLPTIEVSEDCIDRAEALKAYNDAIEELVKAEMEEFNLGDFTECSFNTTQLKLIARKIWDAPSVVPTTENEIKLCRNCDNAYIYQDCLYCDEIEEETEIEPDDACSLWKLRVSLE